MQKKIAVLVRERQSEALRMSLGLILVDDQVDVYVLDRKVRSSWSAMTVAARNCRRTTISAARRECAGLCRRAHQEISLSQAKILSTSVS